MNTNDIKKHYRYWVTEKGNFEEVVLKKYLGLRGFNGYIKTIEHDGITYCGEVWLCETVDKRIIQCCFKKPYDDSMRNESVNVYYFQNNDLVDNPNAYFDGLEAYLSNDLSKRKSNIPKQEQILYDRIENLKTAFELESDTDLKLGIQLYLRRLETPDHYTRKDWVEWYKCNPLLHSEIVDISYGKEGLGI